MQALSVNPVDLVNPVNSIKLPTSVVCVNSDIKPAKKPIDTVIEPELSNLTAKKDNSINRFLEAYGDCV